MLEGEKKLTICAFSSSGSVPHRYLFDDIGSVLLALALLSGAPLVSLKIWKRSVETSERREIQRSAISASSRAEEEHRFSVKRDSIQAGRSAGGPTPWAP